MSNDLTNLIAQAIKASDVSSTIREMTIGQLIQGLEDQGLFLLVFMTGKGQTPFMVGEKELIKTKFMQKYGLSEADIKTISLCAQGLTDEKIAERLGTISADGIRKRLKKIRNRIGASNKVEIVAKANEEGIV